ncbi:MAG: anti-sigma factor, partial [Pacificimonas sp.]
MSDDDIPTPEMARALDAAEYVLRLRDAADHAVLEARLTTDAAFAADVDWWENRFAPLLDQAEEITPDAELWPRVHAAITNAAMTAAAASPAGPAANDDSTDTARAKLRWWRGYGIAASLVAIGLGSALLLQPEPEPEVRTVTVEQPAPAPQFLSASLAPEAGVAVAVITYDATSGRLAVAPLAINAGTGQVPELWIVPSEGAPQSLG